MARKKRDEQGFLADLGPVRNDRVHAAAVNYAELRDGRIAAGREEKDAQDTLLAIMAEEGVEFYEYDGLKVSINLKKKAVVSTEKPGEREE